MAYAKPTYDPVKAHEYYEKHKKLKGKRSTKGFTDKQKELLKYGKDQLTEERKQKIKALTEEGSTRKKAITKQTSAKNASVRDTRAEMIAKIRQDAKVKKQRLKDQMNDKIESMRNRMATMSPEDKARFKTQLQGTIQSFRLTLQRQSGSIDSIANSLIGNEREKANRKMSENKLKSDELKQGVTKDIKAKKEKEWEEFEKAIDKWYAEVKARG